MHAENVTISCFAIKGKSSTPSKCILNEIRHALSASASHEKVYLIGAKREEGKSSAARIRNTDSLPHYTIESSCAKRLGVLIRELGGRV